MFGVNIERNRVKARVSMQAGTYVQSNYSAEPEVGDISGPSVSQNIQDAFISYNITNQLNIISGIYPSHIGYESLLSIDNCTYTRSLAAEYSPYYQSGVGFIYNLNSNWLAELHILNGWQNISEDDNSKSLGIAIRFNHDGLKLNYTNYFGNYLGRQRQFHDINIEKIFTTKFMIKGLYNWGVQESSNMDKEFYTLNIQTLYKLSEINSISLRLEYYNDPDEGNVSTENNQGFLVRGGSFGFDHIIEKDTVFRVEHKSLYANEDVFLKKDKRTDINQLLVLSVAIKI